MTAIAGHDPSVIPDGAQWIAVCQCGWTSSPVHDAAQAEARLRIHTRCVKEASRLRQMTAVYEAAARRSSKLVEQWEKARSQREDLRRRRTELIVDWERRWQSASALTCRTTVKVRETTADRLEAARRLAGLSLRQLWLAYFAVGGNASLEDLGTALREGHPLPPGEYNQVALALNEHFASEGLGRPVAYWGEET